MCVYSDVMVPPEEFILGRTLRAHPDLRVELERAVLIDTDTAPYLWITNADDDVETTVKSEPEIDRVELIDRVDNELLVRIEWSDRDIGLIRTLVETNATCLKCTGLSDGWHLTLRFPSSSGLTECYRRCADENRTLTVKSIRNGGRSSERHLASNLSDPQREAIYTALERGYFAVPRQITLQELADTLGISDTAASQRLRRGLEDLLTDVLPGVRPSGAVPTLPSKAP